MTDKVKRAIALVVLVLGVVGALVLIGVIQGHPHHTSYGDGYVWGFQNVDRSTAPACSRAEMTSGVRVADPNFPGVRPTGDGVPGDKFTRWHAGCEAGAKAEIKGT